MTCRYVAGTGLDGMVSELPKSRRAVVHLAAVLMVWQLHGKTFELPGESAAEPPEPSNILTASDCEFLQQIRAVVSELLSNGLSHVSEVTASHLQALNMSAGGEGLPRLAAMLRNLEGTIELLAQRDFRADEHEALDQLAKIHALCAAMEMTDADLAPLRGRRRGDHTVQEEMELHPWGGVGGKTAAAQGG